MQRCILFYLISWLPRFQCCHDSHGCQDSWLPDGNRLCLDIWPIQSSTCEITLNCCCPELNLLCPHAQMHNIGCYRFAGRDRAVADRWMWILSDAQQSVLRISNTHLLYCNQHLAMLNQMGLIRVWSRLDWCNQLLFRCKQKNTYCFSLVCCFLLHRIILLQLLTDHSIFTK